MAASSSSPPSISVTLTISPRIFSLGDDVELSVTATSHAAHPITIYTRTTVFNLDRAQSTGNFVCVDLDTNIPVRLAFTKGGKRAGHDFQLGGTEDEYFQTLMPQQPVTFSGPCSIATRTFTPEAVSDNRVLLPGHRYRLGVAEREFIWWWRVGTKEESLAHPGEDMPDHQCKPSGSSIDLTNIEPVEFTVAPFKT